MSDFNEQLPEWNAAGTEPPAQKKAEGWQPREKPPAGWFNWLFNRAFKCIEEIRGVVSGVITSLTGLNNTVSTHKADYPNHGNLKNKIINGNFGIWQRGTSFNRTSAFTVNIYTADRWAWDNLTNNTTEVSQLALPVGMFERGIFGVRCKRTTTASNEFNFKQRIEGVRTLAGTTVTLSFWVKGNANYTATVLAVQNFGSGGSSIVVANLQSYGVTASWQKIVRSFTLPSVEGRTIGANNFLEIRIIGNVTGNFEIDITQIQLEEGAIATPFEHRPIGLELALCKRYYEKSYGLEVAPGTVNALGSVSFQTRTAIAESTAGMLYPGPLSFKVNKMIAPSVSIISSDTGVSGTVRNATTSNDRAGVTGDLISTSGIGRLNVSNASANSISADNVLRFHWVADAEL